MYIIFSLVALLALIGMILLDETLLKDLNIKLTLLIKSVVLALFSIILLLATKTDGKLNDFEGIEWLYLVLISAMMAFLFFYYNFIIRKINHSQIGLFGVPSILGVASIFILVNYIKNISDINIASLILIVVVLVLVVTLFLFNLLKNKDANKLTMLYVLILGALVPVSYLLSRDIIARQRFEVYFFYASMACLVISLIYLLLDIKDSKIAKTFKKFRWQDYLLVVMAVALMIATYMFIAKAQTEKNSIIEVTYLIVGLAPIALFFIDYFANRKEIIFKEYISKNKVYIPSYFIMLISLILYVISGNI